MSKALNEPEATVSLSEPDVFSNFVPLRYNDTETLVRLLRGCFHVAFRPAVVRGASFYGLKLRNQCVEIMELYCEAFPQAKHLFLYRNAIGWVTSLYRLSIRRGPRPDISRDEAVTRLATYHNRTIADVERFFDPSHKTYSTVTYLATDWLVMMDRYLELFSERSGPLAIRYEDLNTQPESVMTAIFKYCNLPLSGITQALQAFMRDSQEGTLLARDVAQTGNSVKLSDEHIAEIQAVLNHHPVIQTPNYLLPGTLTFG